VDVTQAVAVRHVDVAVRCHHRVAGLLINAGILGPVERPHSLAVQGGPDHHVALVIRKVEILGAAFLTQKAAVGLFLKSRFLGLDVLAFVIEDDDGVFAMVADHDLVVRSDLKGVGVTILDPRLEDTPARDEFIGVRSAPERRLCCRTCSSGRGPARAPRRRRPLPLRRLVRNLRRETDCLVLIHRCADTSHSLGVAGRTPAQFNVFAKFRTQHQIRQSQVSITGFALADSGINLRPS